MKLEITTLESWDTSIVKKLWKLNSSDLGLKTENM